MADEGCCRNRSDELLAFRYRGPTLYNPRSKLLLTQLVSQGKGSGSEVADREAPEPLFENRDHVQLTSLQSRIF